MTGSARRRRALLAWWWAGAALVAPAGARAAAPQVRLRWEAADARCLGAEALRGAVDRALGRQAFGDGPGLAEVRGRVEPFGGGFRASIELVEGGETRSRRQLSTGKVCGRLDESIAVVVALMIDSVLAPAEPVQVAVPDVSPEAPYTPPPPPPAPAAPPAGRAPVLGLGLVGGAGRGLLPGWTPEVGLVAVVRPAGWLGLEAEVRDHASARLVRGDGAGGEFSAWTGVLRACAAPWSSGRLRLEGCAGAGSGRLAGTAVGLIAAPTPSGALLFAALTPARLGVRLAPHVWLAADASVRLMVRRDRFGYLDPGGSLETVHRPSLLVPTGALSVVVESAP